MLPKETHSRRKDTHRQKMKEKGYSMQMGTKTGVNYTFVLLSDKTDYYKR